jgi:WD40 repeat protein
MGPLQKQLIAGVALSFLSVGSLRAQESKPFSTTFPLDVFTEFLNLGNWDITPTLGVPRVAEQGHISEAESFGTERRLLVDRSHNGVYLLTGDGFLFRYNIDTLKREFALRIPDTGLNDFAQSKNGELGLVAGDKGLLGVVTAGASPTVRRFPRDSKITFSSVSFHPQEQLFAAADLDGGVEVARVDTGEVLWRFRAHHWPVSGLSFSSNGDFLYTADTSEILLWNVTTGKVVRRLVPGDGAARHWFHSFAFSSDRNLVAASTVGKLFVFDL